MREHRAGGEDVDRDPARGADAADGGEVRQERGVDAIGAGLGIGLEPPLGLAQVVGSGHQPVGAGDEHEVAGQGAGGLAGGSIEDTDLPGEGAYWFDLAIDRVRAAAEAARALPRDFVLVARADGLMTGAYDLREAERRLEAYAEAGADCVYAPLLPDLAAVRRVCAAGGVPLNVLAAGPMLAHSRAELADAGVARISLGSGLARVGQAAVLAAARAALEAGDFRPLAGGVPGSEVDAMLAQGARRTPKQ